VRQLDRSSRTELSIQRSAHRASSESGLAVTATTNAPRERAARAASSTRAVVPEWETATTTDRGVRDMYVSRESCMACTARRRRPASRANQTSAHIPANRLSPHPVTTQSSTSRAVRTSINSATGRAKDRKGGCPEFRGTSVAARCSGCVHGLIMTGGTDGLLGDMPLECGP